MVKLLQDLLRLYRHFDSMVGSIEELDARLKEVAEGEDEAGSSQQDLQRLIQTENLTKRRQEMLEKLNGIYRSGVIEQVGMTQNQMRLEFQASSLPANLLGFEKLGIEARVPTNVVASAPPLER